MSPATRARIVDALDSILPLPQDCPLCDPNGGCANATECRRILAEQVLDVVEREST